ncbi:hypothetical protein [Mumia sp. DW29H23]|uniref:hypothetical protein n=1 Tax=Mumia sp. DW29H23 TaxID=3421241 RepID=UPI003D693F31
MPTNLPLADYDQLTPSAITVRLRALGIDGVIALLDHEQHHAARPTVCQILEHRIDTLARARRG